MRLNEKHTIRIAILDLNAGYPNQGMRCIRDIVKSWGAGNNYHIHLEEFDVRLNNAVPDDTFDIYISSGGPGSPLDSVNTEWENRYFTWLKSIEAWNADENKGVKKHAFFICHSFQLACRHYNLGNVSRRKSTSFGIFPIHLMQEGYEEVVFEGLKDPFYAVDSRDYQLIEPDRQRINAMGGKILALEKDRPHVPLERAVMAVRFNDYFIGTQFHPEADACGMSLYLQRDDKKQTVIENHGYEKWKSMIEHLNDPDKISYTYSHILPNFLNQATGQLVTMA